MKIPLSKPYHSKEIDDAVLRVVHSGKHIGGEEVEKFEKDFANYLGVKHVVTVNSATSAEMLTLLSLGIGSGDEVLVPSHTAFPTIEPIFHVGATPVFVDVDNTYTINTKDLESKLTENSKAIIPVHLYGHPANMDSIIKLAKERNLLVVEDCAQAHDARYKNKIVGTIGDASIFSFFPSKNLGTIGDGGAVATDNKELADKVRSLRDHGRASRYINNYVGYNMRFDPVKAAVLNVKLPLLPEFTAARRRNAQRYNEKLSGLDLILPVETEDVKSVYHLYVVRLSKGENDRDKLVCYLKEHGIETNVHYPVPSHKQPAVISRIGDIKLPFTETLVNEIISLPMYPALKEDEIDYVSDKIREFLDGRL